MNDTYRKALSEVSIVVNALPKDLKNRISQSFLNFIEKHKSKIYKPNFDMNLPLSEQKFMQETKVFLSLIYRSYLCDNETKRKLQLEDAIELKKIQSDLNKKYSYENLFKKSK